MSLVMRLAWAMKEKTINIMLCTMRCLLGQVWGLKILPIIGLCGGSAIILKK